MKGSGLYDPEYEATCVILWLVALFANLLPELNKAMTLMGQDQVEALGPFAKALHEVIVGCEEQRADRLRPGLDVSETSVLGNFNAMFLLYYGTTSAEQSLESWRSYIGAKSMHQEFDEQTNDYIFDATKPGYINLNGYLRATEIFKLAVDQSFMKVEQVIQDNSEVKPVVLVILVQNLFRYEALRLNQLAHTPWPGLREVLLMDMIEMYVLDTQTVKVDGKDVELVFLFNTLS